MGIDGSGNEKCRCGRFSVWAIVSVALALLPWMLHWLFSVLIWGTPSLLLVPSTLAVISGVIALRSLRYRNHTLRGKGLAIAGIVIPVVGVAWFFPFLVPSILAVSGGVIALRSIRYRNHDARHKWIAITGIAVSAACVAFYIISVWNLNRLIYKPMAEIRNCQGNMSKLYGAIKEYADMHGGVIPNGSAWCDELLAEGSVDARTFLCPRRGGPSRQTAYALNKNVAGLPLAEIPRKTVLLFESIPGWNQVGGIELIADDNHAVMSTWYANVVLAGGHAQHCQQREMEELQWLP